MILWDDSNLPSIHIGRGQVPPKPPMKKLSPSKVATDAVAVLRSKIKDNVFKPKHLDDAAELALKALRERMALNGKAAAALPWDAESAGLAYQLAWKRPSWNHKRSQPVKLVRDWLLNDGGELAIRAVVASWRWQHECSWQYGSKLAMQVSIRRSDTAEWEGITDHQYVAAASSAVDGWRELRRLLAYADEEVYASAVATVREVWPDQPRIVQALLAYLCPTEQDLAMQVHAGPAFHQAPAQLWLLWSLQHPAAVADLARASRVPHDAWWPLLALGDVDAVVREVGDGEHYFTRELGLYVDAPTLATLFSTAEEEEASVYFMRFPRRALEVLAEDSALRRKVLRAHPELDDNALPTASDDEVPTLLQQDNARLKKPLPDLWLPYADLYLLGQETVLSPAQLTRLGKALMASSGRITPALQEVHDALDPESRGAFGLALYESYRHAYRAPSWLFRSLCLLHSDAVVDRVSADIASMDYLTGTTALEILATIASERALLRVAHVAAKGRGRGIKNAAEGWLHTIAERRGLSKDQLADRLVPDLGLDHGGTLTLDLGPRQFTVAFDESLKPYLVDDQGKSRKSLPKSTSDDPDKVTEAKARWSALKKAARTIASVQVSRLEQAMVCGRTWTSDEFHRYLTDHPVLRHLVRRLLWAVQTDEGLVCFRVEGRAFTDRFDESLSLPEGDICLPHPLQLEEELPAWSEVFTDYEIIQPFEQLSRARFRPNTPAADAVIDRVHGGRAKGGTIAALTNRGWQRGGVEDAGQWYEAWWTSDDLEAQLEMDHGVNISGGYGYDEDQNLTLTLKVGGNAGVGFSEALRSLAMLNLLD